MKYKIEGIEKSNTIKSTQVVNTKNKKAIMVNYLDGTQDVFELNDEILHKIETIMNDQAQKFCDKYTKSNITFKGVKQFFAALLIVFGTASTALLAFNALVPAIVMSSLGVTSLSLLAAACREEKYYLKYKLYIDSTMNKLQEYKDILEKEKQLSLSKSSKNDCKIKDVGDLDKVSYKYVRSIEEKVDRYNAIDPQKKKTLQNSGLH